jgi:Fe-S cluster assembly protein SufD
VLLLSLAEAVAQQPELVRRYLGPEQARPGDSKFDALVAALWGDGVFVYVPRGLSIESPFQIVHWSDAEGAALSRMIVVAEEASCLALVDSYASPPDHPESLASGTIEVIEGQAARVTYVHLQERDEQLWSFTSLRSEQERDSAMTWLLLGLGGRLSRNELTCALNGQGAEADLLGLIFGEANQHFDLQSLQDHVASDTRSDLVLKVALRDKATSNFTGLIRVGKTALRTSSNQENRNLLLSGEAKADSDPKLEILNSDVTRCGHGATVGPVDEEMIFYLMTRGLSHDEAERLIVEGFFEPLLGQVPIEGVRQRLWASIERKLQS